MSASFKDKTVLITGGTGSFGRAFTQLLIEEDLCKKVIILSRDEWKQWEMQHSSPIFDHPKMRYFLGDVRDKERLLLAFRDVDYVVHAAALKQVPAAEYNPSEFVKTNIHGAMNVIDAAMERGVEKVIALSTDKAVNPVNLYGATKLCSDKLIVASNAYAGATRKPRLSVVRYGNVLGSRGSLLPYWRTCLEKGAKELPITHEAMTRFWITLEEAARFVHATLLRMQGGEIFVPKIPSIPIIDLAKAMTPHVPVKIVGIREGEKLHELLIHAEEGAYTFEWDDHYVILPPVHMKPLEERAKSLPGSGKRVPAGFTYASDTNPYRLSHEEIKALLKPLIAP